MKEEWTGCISRVSEHWLEVSILLLFSIIAPSLDVYTDTFFTVFLIQRDKLPYAAWLALPQAANTCLTLVLWHRLEPEETKSWSWVLVVLQCWPQVVAARVIWAIATNKKEWKEMKEELDTQVCTLEPYMESMPSLVVYLTIFAVEGLVKNNAEFDNTDGPEGNDSWSHHLFMTSLISSFFLSSFGIIKFFKNGPIRFLDSCGFLSGFISPKLLLVFFSVFFLNVGKMLLLLEMIESRVADRLLYSVMATGPEDSSQITLLYFSYVHEEDVFNRTVEDKQIKVFIGQTRVQIGPEDSSNFTFLIWNSSIQQWSYSYSPTCLSAVLEESNRTCTSMLPSNMLPLAGDWKSKTHGLSTLLLWTCLVLGPSLLLSLSVLSRPSIRHLPHLLLQHPQLLLTPVFSPFSPGPTPGWGASRLSLSTTYSWINSILHIISVTIGLILFFLPGTIAHILHSLIHGLTDVQISHKGLVGGSIGLVVLSSALCAFIIHLPSSRSNQVML